MSSIKDCGPAFPQDYEHTKAAILAHKAGEISAEQLLHCARQLRGMTLRDYFAAKAMQGELSASVCTDEKSDYGIPLNVSDEKLDRMTRHWFRIADSMLRARGET